MNWSNLIRQLRRSLQLGQAAFAVRLGVSQSAVSKWERGIDIPGQKARNKIIDLTSNDNRAFRDASVVCQARFAPLPVHLVDLKARIIEISDPCASDWHRSRDEMISHGSLVGVFGEMCDDTIYTMIANGLFDSGVIGMSAETQLVRPCRDKAETVGISVWASPVFLSDGSILTMCNHRIIPVDQITNPGIVRTLHIDHVCV